MQRLKGHKHSILRITAYLLLALAVAYSFKLERSHSNENRASLAATTHNVLVQGCNRNNQLRKTLQHLVLDGIPTVRQYVQAGTLTPDQGANAIAQAKKSAAKIAPINCSRFYSINESKSSP